MFKPGLETQQAFDCRATAALLRSLAPLVWSSQAAALAAAWQPQGWCVLVCWAAVLYFAVRVELDARLFELFAQDPAQAPSRLDEWLERSGLRKPAASERTIAERCAGARRLAKWLVGTWALQMFVLVAVMVKGKI